MAQRVAPNLVSGPGVLGYLAAALLVVVCFKAIDGPLGGRADASVTRSVAMTATERGFVSALEQVRAEHDLPAFSGDGQLAAAARAHSREMVATGTFAHGAFWERIEAHGVTSGQVGETLGWTSVPAGAVARIVAAWLASPEHRRILLDPVYRQVGVGVADGSFKGYPNAVVVTADFHGA
ncbi:MAG TPA: CAP domain-containing protein [Gaiellaceae bacterium]|nr:CAP domain-containing protein [Gaiellaceae bacterium]